ncbi:MAG: hypothetical protein QOG23_2147 [Blastocatellia bacterium]|nr:hypothetical protein [Blastocatellia bacterium]
MAAASVSLLCRCSFFWFGAFERVSPLLARKGNDWVPTPHTEGRNAVEHSERSAELCGWAVVENEAQRGEKGKDPAKVAAGLRGGL